MRATLVVGDEQTLSVEAAEAGDRAGRSNSADGNT